MSAQSSDDFYGSTLLNQAQVLALVRTTEAALSLRHGAQFFVWTQGSLQQLLPHQLLLCGAYQRSHRELGFELFNSKPLPAALATLLSSRGAALPAQLQSLWLSGGCRPLRVQLPADSGEPVCGLLRQAGYGELLVHGVSRPQRPSEIESFFVLARQDGGYSEHQQVLLQLLMPHLHSSWLRVRAEVPEPAAGPQAGVSLTQRELEVLEGLRRGLSNHDIGRSLDISALTVKNHVQRILRKLGASNRAHAVALALKPWDGGVQAR
ncbi:helix-turn-helix transcriptional regulator [Paucibacter sp. PLA-PC-4]|uniref:helix-turn-helix transcriptional regulator n=1 Tax=Paucibacter sp. PLA-PC-4 TaxID=2993655 RepID=UPI002248E723|nr:helix-turn-helix transcriptional regulator [Paucibacter sp. PLA-PC-4]MCX2861167.1 helix-turn-helix transcriptional regulator [Paucibacter sp. PLA-PC-4]